MDRISFFIAAADRMVDETFFSFYPLENVIIILQSILLRNVLQELQRQPLTLNILILLNPKTYPLPAHGKKRAIKG